MGRVALIAAVLGALLSPPARAGGDEAVNLSAPLTYEKHVRPLLKTHCFQCHGEDSRRVKGKLDLRLRRTMVEGGKSGPAVLPGKAAGSLLFQRVRDGEMPPDDKKKLSRDEVELIGKWIDAGAPTARPEPDRPPDTGEPTAEERSHWSFQLIARPPVPKPRHAAGVRTPVDAFLLAALEARGLGFSPEADRSVLLRRAAFDLTGLPPAPEDAAAFLADDAPGAWERLLDRLLSSPRYGERWARHWLDVAGYADSEGYNEDDVERRHAYQYRDYVIRSLNADKPFDRFIREQVAGDEMISSPLADLRREDVEPLTATGFLRMAPDGTATTPSDMVLARNQVVADTIQIVSTALLGLTVNCAQCHNHRYDPIPQTDYFRIRAVFEPGYDVANWRTPQQRLVSLYSAADRKAAAEIEAGAAKIDKERTKRQEELIEAVLARELAKIPEELRGRLREARAVPAAKRGPEQRKLLKEHPSVDVSAGSLYLYDKKAADELKKLADDAAAIRAKKPLEEFVPALTEVPGKVPETRLFYRGDPKQPKEAVPPGGLTILGLREFPPDDPTLPTTGRRRAFARWLSDGRHPLTARVVVNRVWMHHFGRGIVGTPADFGLLGDRPTHPELLDWLASEFMAGGWSLKRLHQLILGSAAWMQSSRREARGDAADPDNRLLWRMPLHRLEAEVLRDSLLALGGNLNTKMFGPPVPVMPDEVGQIVVGRENTNAGRPGAVLPLNGEEFRRSLYVQARRSRPLGMLDAFDLPAMEPNCEARNASTVAPQALMLMNSEFVVSQCERIARRVAKEAGSDSAAQAALAWRAAYSAGPSKDEAAGAAAFVERLEAHFRANAGADKEDPRIRALACLCQALVSSNRFLYID